MNKSLAGVDVVWTFFRESDVVEMLVERVFLVSGVVKTVFGLSKKKRFFLFFTTNKRKSSRTWW